MTETPATPARGSGGSGGSGGKAFRIAIVGAESTGKTTLAGELGATLAARGERVAVVAEYLRDFFHAAGRTPRRDEQAAIAATQQAHVDAVAQDADVVVADTSALMIAVYSDHVFGDTTLYADAEAAQRTFDLTLLTALDLPWQADAPREGPHVRAPVDARVRAALARAGTPFVSIEGTGAARLDAALRAVDAVRIEAKNAEPPER